MDPLMMPELARLEPARCLPRFDDLEAIQHRSFRWGTGRRDCCRARIFVVRDRLEVTKLQIQRGNSPKVGPASGRIGPRSAKLGPIPAELDRNRSTLAKLDQLRPNMSRSSTVHVPKWPGPGPPTSVSRATSEPEHRGIGKTRTLSRHCGGEHPADQISGLPRTTPPTDIMSRPLAPPLRHTSALHAHDLV